MFSVLGGYVLKIYIMFNLKFSPIMYGCDLMIYFNVVV
jgi:hypothetical protein